jgi:predicted transcriptional regulator
MDIAQLRRKTGLNQSDFWSRVLVTQSGGSRYEGGRRIPKPVQVLIDIAFGNDRQRERAIARLRGAK